MIDAAIASGVTHFYPSEYGNEIEQPEFIDNQYYIHKVATRRYLQEMAKLHKDFKYTLVLIGLFAETFALTDIFGVQREKGQFISYGYPDREISISSMAE
jgi:hypothetical protein